MTTERKFFQALKRAAPPWLTLTRIETGQTASGVPDVAYAARLPGGRHVVGWIELKVARPSRNGGYRLGHVLTWPQCQFLLAHSDSVHQPPHFASYLAVGVYPRGSTRPRGVLWISARETVRLAGKSVVRLPEHTEHLLSPIFWWSVLT